MFYKYVAVPDTTAEAESQRAVCERLKLTGRIRLAAEGINGHLAGCPEALRSYREHNEWTQLFSDVHYKVSKADTCPFGGEFFVRIASEITSAGPQMRDASLEAMGETSGTHLSAREFHEAVLRCQKHESSGGKKQVLIDTRNHYETAVGRFEGAVDPKLRTFSQFPGWVAANKESLQGADVYMYCTGGIRCEKASVYLSSLGIASSVSQLAGGIHAYLAEYSSEAREAGVKTSGLPPGQQAQNEVAVESKSTEKRAVKKHRVAEDNDSCQPDECLWQGANYSFDDRYASRLAGGSGSFGRCCYCGASWNTISAEVVCSVCCDQILVCDSCRLDCVGRSKANDNNSAENSAEKVLPESSVLSVEQVSDSPYDQPIPPPPDVMKAKGVNFSKRIEAEQKSVYLCTEHNLLSDGWREFLSRAEAQGLPLHSLESALLQLNKQLAASKGRGGKARRRNLQAQIDRVTMFLEERGMQVPEGDDKVVNELAEGNITNEWAAFFPLLNLWDC